MKKIATLLAIAGLSLSACGKDNTPSQDSSASGKTVSQTDLQPNNKNITVTPKQVTAPQVTIVGQWNPDEASEPYLLVVNADGSFEVIAESETTEGKWKKNDDGTFTLAHPMEMLGEFVRLEMKNGVPKMIPVYQGKDMKAYTKGQD